MKEDESNWLSKWEEQLPSPEELPLTQTLITPDLAHAFDIDHNVNASHSTPPPTHPAPIRWSVAHLYSSEFENSGDLGSGGGANGYEPARTSKRPRVVWTSKLHKKFVDAVAQLGIENAVPSRIMQLMNVKGLTRSNVSSHLQKYRLYLKRKQEPSNGGGTVLSDPATDRSSASSTAPPHILHPCQEHSVPFVPPPQPSRPIRVPHPQQQQQFNPATDHLLASSDVPGHFMHPARPGHQHYVPFVPPPQPSRPIRVPHPQQQQQFNPATDHLLASSDVPGHFMHPARPGHQHYVPFVPPPQPSRPIRVPHPQQQQQFNPATDHLLASSDVPGHFMHPARPGHQHSVPFVPPPQPSRPIRVPHPQQQQQQFNPATDHLLASSDVPGHFMHPARPGHQHSVPFVPPPQPSRPIRVPHPQQQQQFNPATDHLLASSDVPGHFMHPARPGQQHSVPFVPPPQPSRTIRVPNPLLQQQFPALFMHPVRPGQHFMPFIPEQQFHQQRPLGHFGSPPNNSQFEHSFLARQTQQPVHRTGAPPNREDVDTGDTNGERKTFKLFPTGDN